MAGAVVKTASAPVRRSVGGPIKAVLMGLGALMLAAFVVREVPSLMREIKIEMM